MKKYLSILFFSFAATAAYPQTAPLVSQYGITVNCDMQKTGTDKKHDKWRITVNVENSSPVDLFFPAKIADGVYAGSYLKVDVTNSKGFLTNNVTYISGDKTTSPGPDAATVIYKVKPGHFTQSFNTNVAFGDTPMLKSSFTQTLKTNDEIMQLYPAQTTATIPATTAVPSNQSTLPGGQISSRSTASAERTFIISAEGDVQHGRKENVLRFRGVNNQVMRVKLIDGKFYQYNRNDLSDGAPINEILFLGWNNNPYAAVAGEDGNSFKVTDRRNFLPAKTQGMIQFKGDDGLNYQASLESATNQARALSTGAILKATQSRTSQNQQYFLIMQPDGNLVLYKTGGVPLWATNTQGKNAVSAEMNGDGSLILRQASGAMVWTSNTDGNPGASLSISENGKLEIRRQDGTMIWASN